MHHILLECISDYSESILQLFDLESLMVFLTQIDSVAKEKGTQVIEHFLHTNNVDQFVNDLVNSVTLTTVQQTQADYLCEEIANFSFYYQTYCHFVCTTIYKQCGQNSDKHIQRIQK